MQQIRLHLLLFVVFNVAIASNVNRSLISNDVQTNHSEIIDLPVVKSVQSNASQIGSVQATVANKLVNKAFSRKRKLDNTLNIPSSDAAEWKCPNVGENSQSLECGCDMPHTLRCSGDIHGLDQLARGLRASKYSVSLLDCTLKNVTILSDTRIFENVSLNGLVISSGEIKRIHRLAFLGMKTPLQTLGLPNNALPEVPANALAPLSALERLDLSNNRIKAVSSLDFAKMTNLTYLELSNNQISAISPKALLSLKKLITLKMNGNRLGETPISLQTIGFCTNLRELDLASNSIQGVLKQDTIPALRFLELLNLDRNLLTSIYSGALQNFPYLVTLSLRHNQIDVLQDHAFAGLGSLQMLDMSYNGIVAVSESSLKHLPCLTVLNLTHNFLRALTSDLIAPLPALRDLTLDGNDISIVEKNALKTAQHLHSLSLRNNPLACDCNMRPFAEWISESRISTQDLVDAVCATPPHLEGAPLFQIAVESLSCDASLSNKYDDTNVVKQLNALAKQQNLTASSDLSRAITLKNFHLSPDYGLILMWNVNMTDDEFACNSLFVYHETELDELLMRNSPIKIQCESNAEEVLSVILHDTEHFSIGENYRFCMVLTHRIHENHELIVGCSNVTKLKMIESSEDDVIASSTRSNDDSELSSTISDISDFSRMLESTNDDSEETISEPTRKSAWTNVDHTIKSSSTETMSSRRTSTTRDVATVASCFSILVVLLIALLWMMVQVRNNRRPCPATICYAADDRTGDSEKTNRYLKLQATTTL